MINKIIAHINDDMEEVKDCTEDTDPIGYGVRLGLMMSRAYMEVIRDNEYSAEWENIKRLAFPTKETDRWYCSECHGVIEGRRYRYCPHCGRFMKGVK